MRKAIVIFLHRICISTFSLRIFFFLLLLLLALSWSAVCLTLKKRAFFLVNDLDDQRQLASFSSTVRGTFFFLSNLLFVCSFFSNFDQFIYISLFLYFFPRLSLLCSRPCFSFLFLSLFLSLLSSDSLYCIRILLLSSSSLITVYSSFLFY